MMQHVLKTSLLAPLLLMAGCASLNYEPVTLDSPPPQAAGKPLDTGTPCPPDLVEGTTCMAIVRAENWYSDTGVRVKAGEAYCIRVPASQVWFDAERRNSPPHGEPGSFLMNLLKQAKRHPVPWFTLMAAVVDDPKSPPKQDQDLSRKRLIEVAAGGAEKGLLVLYPNDARGPASAPDYFYKNNHGQIWVQVARLSPGQACTDVLAPQAPALR